MKIVAKVLRCCLLFDLSQLFMIPRDSRSGSYALHNQCSSLSRLALRACPYHIYLVDDYNILRASDDLTHLWYCKSGQVKVRDALLVSKICMGLCLHLVNVKV